MSGDRVYRPAAPLARGALALCGWRLALRALLSVPLVVAALGVAASAARRPYFADAPRPLPALQLADMLAKPGTLAPLVAALAALWVVIEQILAAGALSWLDPMRLSRPRPLGAERTSVTRTLARDGAAHLWIMLRVVLLAALLAFGAQRGLWAAQHAIVEAAEPTGATGYTLMLTVPLILAAVGALLTVVLSSFALHTRAITVADGRRRVRRTALLALRLWRRHPLRWLVPGLARLALVAAGAALLFAWRQAAPRGGALAAFIAAWAAYLVLETYVWYWLSRAARLLYAGRRAAALRDAPDAPWGLWRRLWRYLAWWRRRRTTSDTTATP